MDMLLRRDNKQDAAAIRAAVVAVLPHWHPDGLAGGFVPYKRASDDNSFRGQLHGDLTPEVVGKIAALCPDCEIEYRRSDTRHLLTTFIEIEREEL